MVRLRSGEWALLDWEFTGLFLPGFDLAMLSVLLAGTPGAADEAHRGRLRCRHADSLVAGCCRAQGAGCGLYRCVARIGRNTV